MSERFKELDLKSSDGRESTVGSNPTPSARIEAMFNEHKIMKTDLDSMEETAIYSDVVKWSTHVTLTHTYIGSNPIVAAIRNVNQ